MPGFGPATFFNIIVPTQVFVSAVQLSLCHQRESVLSPACLKHSRIASSRPSPCTLKPAIANAFFFCFYLSSMTPSTKARLPMASGMPLLTSAISSLMYSSVPVRKVPSAPCRLFQAEQNVRVGGAETLHLNYHILRFVPVGFLQNVHDPSPVRAAAWSPKPAVSRHRESSRPPLRRSGPP